jgi:hypothetical protein
MTTSKEDFAAIVSNFAIPVSYFHMMESGETIFMRAQLPAVQDEAMQCVFLRPIESQKYELMAI